MNESSVKTAVARLAKSREDIERNAFDEGKHAGEIWAEKHANVKHLELLSDSKTVGRVAATPQQLLDLIRYAAPHLVGSGTKVAEDGSFYLDMSDSEMEHWHQGAIHGAKTVYVETIEYERKHNVVRFGDVKLMEMMNSPNAYIKGIPVQKDLSPGKYRVIEALAFAGDRGLTKDELAIQSDTSDPVRILRELSKSEEWKDVLVFPKKKNNGGYRIRSRGQSPSKGKR